MASGDTWTETELLAAFALYCRIPFGRLHAKNPEIIALAERLSRSAGALAMKLVNFAHLDPVQKSRGIAGLTNVSKADVDVWEQFRSKPDETAFAAESALAALGMGEPLPSGPESLPPDGPTESLALVRVRLVQGFFRRAVIASYDSQCAVCDIPLRNLLCASHILPWSVAHNRRADPTNGICLCAYHDRAFDRGLLGFEDDLRIVISTQVDAVANPPTLLRVGLLELRGERGRFPSRFSPAPDCLAYHRQNVLVA